MRRLLSFFILTLAVGLCGIFAVAAHAETTASVLFVRNLKTGSTGLDVLRLQAYLNTHGAPITESGPGSPGNETTYYGPKTAAAVKRFQELHAADILAQYNLTVGTGKFYDATRAFVNKNVGGDTSAPQKTLGEKITNNSPRYLLGGIITGAIVPVIISNTNGETVTKKPGDVANFVFTTGLPSNTTYTVSAHTADSKNTLDCYVTPNGSGVVTDHNITNIIIKCVPAGSQNPFFIVAGGGTNSFTVGGSISGLLGSIVLDNNSLDTLTLTGNGAFTFGTKINDRANYAVSIRTAPNNALENCTVRNGSGTVLGGNVTNITASCATTPTISLGNISKTYGDSPFTVAATTDSDGTITYQSSSSSVATVSGSTITVVGAGTATITATQAASTYYTATSTTATLTVAKADPVIDSLSNLSLNTNQYSGICFEDFDVDTFCTLDSPLRIDLPTSTSNGRYSSLTVSDTSLVEQLTTNATDHLAGYPVIDVPFAVALEFSDFNIVTVGPLVTTATLYQAATANYNAGSVSFTITMNLVANEPGTLNSCSNHGVMLRTVYNTYECACPNRFTGTYCQTVNFDEAFYPLIGRKLAASIRRA